MPNNILPVVAWIFVGVFAITALIALLDLAQIIHIRDPARRKWLFGTVIGSVVIPVISFGAGAFKPVPPAPSDKHTSPAPVTNTVPAPDGPALPDRNSLPSIPKKPSFAIAGPPPVPSAILEWVKSHMPLRPRIPAEFETRYPGCVAKLRADSAKANPSTDATQCRGELEAHKIEFVSKYYDVKLAYDKAILTQQQKLAHGGLDANETEIFNFLQSENEDLNYPGGKSLQAVAAAEIRVNADIEFCRKLQ